MMKPYLRGGTTWTYFLGLIISLALTCTITFLPRAQTFSTADTVHVAEMSSGGNYGLRSWGGALDECAPDTLRVTRILGRVVYELNRGETPLEEAFISLKRGGNLGTVIAKQAIEKDGSFSFGHIKPGKYQLEVAARGLRNFYLDLIVTRSKTARDQKDIYIIMGTDFLKPCAGSYAELRDKKTN